MEVGKILLVLAITMTFSITLTTNIFDKSTTVTETKIKAKTTLPLIEKKEEAATASTTLLPSRPLSRFLAEKEKNPRSASHCNKNKKMCETMYGKGWQCCNNKCVDLRNDKHNCGGCKKKCKYTAECCGGQCVDVAYDKRHCGSCNNRCQRGKFCVYGMCEYA
ncbi:stigma-specific STIG1-like protein 1 [Cucurbita pepo subsp. pepo]|uniref:stigma-specific STIG1-like protein 1 n=1 Tax=Cucurbita pepo subsp. pepo TaxID=3664 RepID=UPI000C9D5288|nr:stigma-specific STIG1-like protein 1 [Cucurbita pepo subsp. pepo]